MFGRRYFAGAYFGPRYWGVGASAVAEPTETFLAALRTRLMSVAGLADLDNVYLTTARPNAPFPRMIISRLWQSPFINLTDAYYKEVGMQFTIHSMDDVEADTLGQAAYDALFPKAANPPILFTDGYEITRRPGMQRGPDALMAGRPGGDPVWQYSFDYVFLVGKN